MLQKLKSAELLDNSEIYNASADKNYELLSELLIEEYCELVSKNEKLSRKYEVLDTLQLDY